MSQRVIFYEEYARAEAPHKVNHLGEELLGPTLIAYGTPEQQQRFLPAIRDVTELWCQGYSNPARARIWPTCPPLQCWTETRG